MGREHEVVGAWNLKVLAVDSPFVAMPVEILRHLLPTFGLASPNGDD